MNDFIPGQRWISEAELQMGLGTILTCDPRSITILFLATGETRIYSRTTAPLSRVKFSEGDNIRAHDGWNLTVKSLQEKNGLITYLGQRDDGSPAELPEGELDNLIQLNRPTERLFSGQIDKRKWFELRQQSLKHHERLSGSDLRGLTGARTSLIPHQLYIAHEVANRYAPRVLLADEVGLGKTIEAGLILHQQLLTGLAKRVLIVVPDSLVHQWLVEMLRRFNLHFTIFDEDRCLGIEESSGLENPFHSAQLALCSLDFVTNDPKRFQQISEGDWDLLVVDEAHHLEWAPHLPSHTYQLIQLLAMEIKGVLLLTATPEQLGKASHFARLHLLDPDRFSDFDTFLKEEQGYQPVAEAVEQLLSDQPLDPQAYQTLLETLDEGDNKGLLTDLDHTARIELMEHLLDRHGTGRVLFRNTRAAVKGFPQRQLHGYPLQLPLEYAMALELVNDNGLSSPQLLLCPELLYQASDIDGQTDWTLLDPRVRWLADQLKKLRPAKVLVIAASADTAIELATALRIKEGIHAAVFHEDMNIVERDRAAAFFANEEDGSQVLICSEIGSEGRNFQFAHHMVMFDLPLNPDLLEQRIGRLDRIGQTDTIQIHAPYLQDSAQEVMFQWYHQGLSAFEQTCPAGHSIFSQVKEPLIEALQQLSNNAESDLNKLISTTQALLSEINEALHNGRDRLLEYNSCRPHVAQALHDKAVKQDQPAQLLEYLEQVFDCYGVDMEEHTQQSYLVRPGEKMQTSFPGLLDEGMIITCDRETALANEDMHYITWEHPMTDGAMDMVLSSELGNTAMVSAKLKGLKPGSLLLECLYVLESSGRSQLQSSRHLPPTVIRALVDASGRDYSQNIDGAAIQLASQKVDRNTTSQVMRAYSEQLRGMVKLADVAANKQVPELLANANRHGKQTLEREVNRLKALQQHNPNIRDEEIQFFELQLEALIAALNSSSPRLDATRVIITT